MIARENPMMFVSPICFSLKGYMYKKKVIGTEVHIIYHILSYHIKYVYHRLYDKHI